MFILKLHRQSVVMMLFSVYCFLDCCLFVLKVLVMILFTFFGLIPWYHLNYFYKKNILMRVFSSLIRIYEKCLNYIISFFNLQMFMIINIRYYKQHSLFETLTFRHLFPLLIVKYKISIKKQKLLMQMCLFSRKEINLFV